MSLALYMDVHVHRAIPIGLRLSGVDVITGQEDGYARASDSLLLDRATELERVLFSQDEDLLAEAKARQLSGKQFAGVIYGHQLRKLVNYGQHLGPTDGVSKLFTYSIHNHPQIGNQL